MGVKGWTRIGVSGCNGGTTHVGRFRDKVRETRLKWYTDIIGEGKTVRREENSGDGATRAEEEETEEEACGHVEGGRESGRNIGGWSEYKRVVGISEENAVVRRRRRRRDPYKPESP